MDGHRHRCVGRAARPSEVRLNRLLVLDDSCHPGARSAALDEAVVDAVVAAAREHHALP